MQFPSVRISNKISFVCSSTGQNLLIIVTLPLHVRPLNPTAQEHSNPIPTVSVHLEPCAHGFGWQWFRTKIIINKKLAFRIK